MSAAAHPAEARQDPAGELLLIGVPAGALLQDSLSEALPGTTVTRLLRCDLLCIWHTLVPCLERTGLMPHLPPVLPLHYPFASSFASIRRALDNGERVGCIVDGDPLFYGLAGTFRKHFPGDRIVIFPELSSMQTACARSGLPWHDMRHVSFHGRESLPGFLAALQSGDNLSVLCDATHTPAGLATCLLEHGVTGCLLHIFSRLCTAGERHTVTTPEECAERPASDPAFADPCILLIERRDRQPAPYLGLDENRLRKAYTSHVSVRATALALLQIRERDVVWDVGSGSGAIAIEACTLARRGRVLAIEERTERVRQIRENRARFGACMLEIVQTHAPDGLETLPRPDAVFLGGGLSQNPVPLLDALCRALVPGGRLVVSCVLFSTLHSIQTFCTERQMSSEILQLTVATSAPLGKDLHLKGHNPVFLVSCHKEQRPEDLSEDHPDDHRSDPDPCAVCMKDSADGPSLSDSERSAASDRNGAFGRNSICEGNA